MTACTVEGAPRALRRRSGKALADEAFPPADDAPARSLERHVWNLALKGRSWQRRGETARSHEPPALPL